MQENIEVNFHKTFALAKLPRSISSGVKSSDCESVNEYNITMVKAFDKFSPFLIKLKISLQYFID